MKTTTEVLRAYRVALDPTAAQEQDLARHAGASRWAHNHALAVKKHAHAGWRQDPAPDASAQDLEHQP